MEKLDKRKLSKIPRGQASPDMMETAGKLEGIYHMVTASLTDDRKILQLTFYNTNNLIKGRTEAEFRTFLSGSDYITQDLKTTKMKWLTAAFDGMQYFSLWDYVWKPEKKEHDYKENVFIRSDEERNMIKTFFDQYRKPEDKLDPWVAVCRFQQKVKDERLAEKHKKETDQIDLLMESVKQEPEEFREWAFDSAMSFSRYLIYQESEKGIAECECTHCGKTGRVSRKEIRLRNNEKGICPFCGSRVTIKAKGRLPYRIMDERWVAYIDPTDEGFVFRYFHVFREIYKEPGCLLSQNRVDQNIYEGVRVFYSFCGQEPVCDAYEYAEYRQSGKTRWCHDMGKIGCAECILYPGNLPDAWKHTPMKYSALEVLSANLPTVSLNYEKAIKKYLKFPRLEWFCKMGLNCLAKDVINENYVNTLIGKINYNGRTIYEILGLSKINTKVLQAVDGNHYILRLLQVSQEIGLQFKPEQLQEYYETFKCNTDLLKQANRKVSLHKLVKYITKESERYPLGDKGGCWQYSYMRYKEREDPRIERKQNMAKDWLEYLEWCRKLKYDLDNIFIYMPKNFRKVHDRTAEEYQALQDRKAAAEKKRRETLARKHMEQMQKAMEEIFRKNDGTDAFSIKGKDLILVVPRSGEDIRAEGEALHHCVGGYVNRVANGETKIFFVRKAGDPDKPYFTMEYKNNRVIQCRGAHNCGMPPDVEAFVKVFEKKMQEADRKQDKNEGRGHRKAG